MIRFGIVGCGAISSTHAEAIRAVPGATLVGFYDVLPERAAKRAAAFEVLAYDDLAKLFGEVDAVCVCVPSGLHAELGIAAARAGKHVLVEKPIEVTLAKAEELVRECRAAGVKLSVISQHRFSRAVQSLRRAAVEGDLGRLLAGDASIKWYRTQAYYDSGDWRGTLALDGGGCLINQGVHYIDMIHWIMGGVRAVQAQTRTAAHEIEVEDIANALIEYRNGAVGVIQGSTSYYPGMAERLEVHGTHGGVMIEGDRVKLWEVDPEAAGQGLYGGGVMQQPTPSRRLADAVSGDDDPSATWGEQHRLQIEDFVDAICDDRDPFITGEMALEPLRVILAIYESARQGGVRVEL
ncbi:MAG: Gfo/Idh/MocA family protein [Fimbriimonas sp.]